MEKDKLVILSGAGFPIMWGAPKSDDLLQIIKSIVKDKMFNNISLCQKLVNNNSFETILAAIESLLYYSIGTYNKDYLTSFFKCSENIDTAILWDLYQECINAIIKKVEEYENSVLQNETIKRSVLSVWDALGTHYKNVNYYTTNYDEIPNKMFNTDFPTLDIHTHIKSRKTFSNLHGSIHLCQEYKGEGYEVIHRVGTCWLNSAIPIKGGNPNELIIFSPIITGQNKTQRITDKYFNYNIVTFANDLCRCDTLLIVGYSFSDPHLNMLIKQYVSIDKTNVVVIDKTDIVHNSSLLDKLFRLFPPQRQYKSDADLDDEFSYNESSLKIYKRGCENLFTNPDLLVALIEKK